MDQETRNPTIVSAYEGTRSSYSASQTKTFTISLGRSIKFKGASATIDADPTLYVNGTIQIAKTDNTQLAIGDTITQLLVSITNGNLNTREYGYMVLVFG